MPHPLPPVPHSVDVFGYRCQNWRSDRPTPFIVNPEADMHALLAWCWAEAQDLSSLVGHCLVPNDLDSQDLAALAYGRLPALVSMLEHLCNHTAAHPVSMSLPTRPKGHLQVLRPPAPATPQRQQAGPGSTTDTTKPTAHRKAPTRPQERAAPAVGAGMSNPGPAVSAALLQPSASRPAAVSG